MKKLYIFPEARLINILPEAMLALSGDINTGGEDGYIDGGDAMSNKRETSLWGDREW